MSRTDPYYPGQPTFDRRDLRRALKRLPPPQREHIEREAERLASTIYGIGRVSALELIASLGAYFSRVRKNGCG